METATNTICGPSLILALAGCHCSVQSSADGCDNPLKAKLYGRNGNERPVANKNRSLFNSKTKPIKQRKRVFRGVLVLLYCFHFIAVTYCLKAERYVEVSAEIQSYVYTNYIVDSKLALHRPIFLSCILSDTNCWRIDANMVDSERKYFFDGTNVYSGLRRLDQVVNLKDQGSMHIKPFDVEQSRSPTVSVFPDSSGRPHGGEDINIPWLAFCSGPYMKRSGRIVPLPVFFITKASGVNGCSDKTATFNDELGLPKTVDLFTSSSLYSSSVLEWNKTFLLNIPTNSNLPEGLLKFHYAVTSSTNFMGWNFPLSFEYIEYEQDPKQLGALVPVYGGIGKLTFIGESVKPESPCTQGQKHVVVDFRIRNDSNVQAIVYSSITPSVAESNNSDLQNRLARQAAAISLEGYVTYRWPKWVICGIIALITFFTLAAILINSLRSKTKKT